MKGSRSAHVHGFDYRKLRLGLEDREKEYRRAIHLNPLRYRAPLVRRISDLDGRFDEHCGGVNAPEAYPLSLIIAADNAMIFYYSRQYDRAEKRLDAVLGMEPTFSRAHMVRSVCKNGTVCESTRRSRKIQP